MKLEGYRKHTAVLMDTVRTMDQMHNGKKDGFGVIPVFKLNLLFTKKYNFSLWFLDLFHPWFSHLKIGYKNTIYHTECRCHESWQYVRGHGTSAWYNFGQNWFFLKYEHWGQMTQWIIWHRISVAALHTHTCVLCADAFMQGLEWQLIDELGAAEKDKGTSMAPS